MPISMFLLTILQYFEHIEEMEWAIEVAKATGMPVAASMCIGPLGDLHGVSAGECAVRMARAGAHVGNQDFSKIILPFCIIGLGLSLSWCQLPF